MRIVGQEQIADVLGVAPKTIVEWQEQGLPVALRGRPGVPSEYDSAACVAWMIERELSKIRTESPADRLARVKADSIEMDNAERRGLLVKAEDIEPALQAAFTLAREAWCDAVPRVSRLVVGKPAAEVEAALQREFEDFLRHLADWRSVDDDEDDEEGDDD